MPITLKFKEIRNPSFIGAYRKLLACDDYPTVKATYNVSRLSDLIDQELKAAEKIFQDLVKKHAKKDDSGKVEMKEGQFEIPDEEMENWERSLEDFGGHEVTLKRHKIKLDDLANVKLNPQDLKALEPILDLPPELH